MNTGNYSLNVKGNSKTNLPTSTSPSTSCPSDCPFNVQTGGAGCYAAYGPIKLHWDKLTCEERGVTWSELLDQIRALESGRGFRHNQAGDLPQTDEGLIDSDALEALTDAASHLRGFTYTHHRLEKENNAQAIKAANRGGFTVNASCNTLDELDSNAANHPDVPMVVVCDDSQPKYAKRSTGPDVVMCPEQTGSKPDCASCMLCAKADRGFAIGFYKHGPVSRGKGVTQKFTKRLVSLGK